MKNLKEWTEKVINVRRLDTNKITVQIGFDDGQKVLKLMQTMKGLEVEGDETETTRRKYSEGYKSRESLMSSVKKLFIIFAVPNVEESYHNVKQIMEKVKCDQEDLASAVCHRLSKVFPKTPEK